MVYESDFYTTRRPYRRTSPTISSYSYTIQPKTIPYIAVKRITTPVIIPHGRVRRSVIRGALDRIQHLPRSHVGASELDDFLNARASVNFDDTVHSIRAQTAALLKRVHTPIPHAVRPLPISSPYKYTETPIPERITSDAYIDVMLLSPNERVLRDVVPMSYYPQTTQQRNSIGRGHLACVSFAAGRVYPRRRLMLFDENNYRNVRNDVQYLSYYSKTRAEVEKQHPQVKLQEEAATLQGGNLEPESTPPARRTHPHAPLQSPITEEQIVNSIRSMNAQNSDESNDIFQKEEEIDAWITHQKKKKSLKNSENDENNLSWQESNEKKIPYSDDSHKLQLDLVPDETETKEETQQEESATYEEETEDIQETKDESTAKPEISEEPLEEVGTEQAKIEDSQNTETIITPENDETQEETDEVQGETTGTKTKEENENYAEDVRIEHEEPIISEYEIEKENENIDTNETKELIELTEESTEELIEVVETTSPEDIEEKFTEPEPQEVETCLLEEEIRDDEKSHDPVDSNEEKDALLSETEENVNDNDEKEVSTHEDVTENPSDKYEVLMDKSVADNKKLDEDKDCSTLEHNDNDGPKSDTDLSDLEEDYPAPEITSVKDTINVPLEANVDDCSLVDDVFEAESAAESLTIKDKKEVQTGQTTEEESSEEESE